jgi:dTMP kinase
MAGFLIIFEGIDGCGKTTQISKLAETLRKKTKKEIVVTKSPGGNYISNEIREMCLSTDNMDKATRLLLFSAALRENIVKVISPAFDRGAIILIDRYTASADAYENGTDEQLYDAQNIVFDKYVHLMPDNSPSTDKRIFSFYLKISPKQSLGRLTGEKKDYYESQSLDFFDTVENNYDSRYSRGKQDSKITDAFRFQTIDASKEAHLVEADIISELQRDKCFRSFLSGDNKLSNLI